ncbi:MAG: hypothetical protein RQ738_13685, partial [Sulfuriflexus sp.]|nr:hypothetical protein [Sulfuriflexus sp.]
GGVWTNEELIPSNLDITPELLGLPDDTLKWWGTTTVGATTDSGETVDEIRRRNLLRYLHGFDSLNVGGDSSVYDPRHWIMGDVLHSRPVVFNYTEYQPAAESVCPESADGGDYNSSVIFVGANDGMLHAFRDCDGKELWGFVPDNVLANLKYLPETKHTSYVDSPPS